MSRKIAISNQKGGVGKTTTAINLASALAEKNKKVLIIDMDPQCNMSSGLGIEKGDFLSLYEVLVDNKNINETIVETDIENLFIVPSNVNLSAADIELSAVIGKEYLLKSALDKIDGEYDFIFFDCPPALSTLTVNAFNAADSIIIPIQCEYYALEGLSQLLNTVNLVKERLNPDLKIEGVLFTMYDSRNNLCNDVINSVTENLQENIYKTKIPRNVKLAEAPSYGLPINHYDKKSQGAEAYSALAEEILKGEM